MRAANCLRCLLILLLLIPGMFPQPAAAEVYAQNTAEQALDQAPQTAPAQNWSTESGKLKATGSLSASGADGNATLSDNSETWAWQVGGRAGMLNEEFAFGVNAAAGWSPGGDWGLWLNLDGEFTGEFVDHYQATLNAGYRLSQDLRLLGTLDYLGKTVEVESWEKDEMLSQYGAGLSLDYSLMQCIDLSGFYQHYKTEGQEYGKIRSYEYVDSNNWQHYGWLYGAVRGGDYDEVGVDANYNLSELGMTFGVGISQIWRTYEEMLGYDSKSTETAAGRLSYGWNDIMATGISLNAGVSLEFADNDNLSWNLSVGRQVGAVSVALTYSEYANDQTSSDRRLYASVNLPIGSVEPEDEARKDRGPRKPAFSGQWLSKPVSGMGTPDLKVSETLERRIDETLVDLSQLPDGVTVSNNLMTITGLPALASLNTTYTSPASAQGAFSIGSGGTTLIVDLSKLPAPASIRAVFLQQNGTYTMLNLGTTKGSVKVSKYLVLSEIPSAMLAAMFDDGNVYYMADKRPINILGIAKVQEGEIYTYLLQTEYWLSSAQDTSAISAQPKHWVLDTSTLKSLWEVSGNGRLIYSSSENHLCKVMALEPGTYTVTLHTVYYEDIEGVRYYAYGKLSKQVTVYSKESGKGYPPENENQPDDIDVDDDDSYATKLKAGDWDFADTAPGGSFAVSFKIDSSGQAVDVTSPDGATSNIVSNISLNGGKVTGTVKCDIGGATHTYTLSINVSGTTIQAGSVIVHSVNAFTETVTVSGSYH